MIKVVHVGIRGDVAVYPSRKEAVRRHGQGIMEYAKKYDGQVVLKARKGNHGIWIDMAEPYHLYVSHSYEIDYRLTMTTKKRKENENTK